MSMVQSDNKVSQKNNNCFLTYASEQKAEDLESITRKTPTKKTFQILTSLPTYELNKFRSTRKQADGSHSYNCERTSISCFEENRLPKKVNGL